MRMFPRILQGLYVYEIHPNILKGYFICKGLIYSVMSAALLSITVVYS